MDLSSTEPIILVDEGYLFFYRYHATMKNLAFSKEPPSDEKIKESFIKHLDQQMEKMKKKLKINTIVFAVDAKPSNVWRVEIYKEYKATRPTVKPELEVLFSDIYKLFINRLKDHGKLLKHKNLESDDIIALLCKHSSMKKVIITSDKDLLQLKKYDDVTILKGNLSEVEGTNDPYHDLMLKVIAGDPSDNIKGIASKKKAQELLNSGKLDEFIEGKNGAKHIVERNKMLIDLDNIPKNLETEFLESLGVIQTPVKQLEPSKTLKILKLTKKECPDNKILNPKTNRCVDITGKIGKVLLENK